MSSQHDDGDGFWGGERDWTDSHRRQNRDGRTSLGDRLRTGVNSVLDVGAGGGRQHGDSGRTPVVEPSSKVESADSSPTSDVVSGAAAGLSIGDLAMPWDAGVHEPTMPVERTNVAVAERPPGFDAAPLEEDPVPAGDGADAAWGDGWEPETHPVPPPRGGIDPLLAKFGVVAVVLTLLVPFILSLRGDSTDRLAGASETASTLGVLDLSDDGEGVSDEATASSDGTAASADGAGADVATASESVSAAPPSADSGGSGDQSSESSTAAAETAEEPLPEESCAVDYDVVDGDYWLRLAEGAGVPLAELLDVNAASANTPLYPGRSICLPAGSSTPPPPPAPSSPPPTAAKSSSSSSSASSSGSSSSSSSSSSSGSSSRPVATAPATTQPPPPPPPPPPAPAVVEQIIRNVWPDELEDKALAIAWRESNYQATAKNYCCYGLFQIYYSVHKSWLSGIGITSGSQLYDAETNARAAYTLYQRSGGWGPWGG